LLVKVHVEIRVSVPYLVDVDDPRNAQQIRDALKLKDPSDWETDPNFYENLGSNWLHSINKTKDFAPSCPKCGHQIEVVSTMSDCYILGCPVHREFDKTFPL